MWLQISSEKYTSTSGYLRKSSLGSLYMHLKKSSSNLAAVLSLSVLGIGIPALSVAVGPVGIPQDAGSFVNEARALVKEGKLPEALVKLDAAIKARPDYTTAYLERAGVLFQLKQYDKAIVDYSQVIKLKPLAPQAYFNRGLCLISLAKPDTKLAVADFSKVIELNPKASPTQDLVIESFEKRGYCNILMAEWQPAISDCTEVLKRSPKRSETLLNRAFAYESMSPPDVEKAIADYSLAIPLVTGPAKVDIFLSRASLYLTLKQYEPAISDLSEGLSVNPKNAEALQARAVAYFQTGKFETSVVDYKNLLVIKPAAASILKDLGAVQLQTKDYAGAATTYTAYLAKAGASPNKDVYKFRALAYMRSVPPNSAAAITDYQAFLASSPQDAVAWHDLSAAAFNAANDNLGPLLDTALAAAEKSLAITPNQVDMLLVRADALSLQSKFEPAISAYTAYLTIKPGDVIGLEGRGRARFNQKQFTEAITDFEAFLAVIPASDKTRPEIERLRILAMGSGITKDPDILIREYTKLINAAPDAKDSTILYTNRGVELFTKSDFRGALKDFSTAATLDGGAIASLKNILSAAYKVYAISKTKADADVVMIAADKVIAKSPADTEAIATRADLLLETKDFTRAITEYTRILTATPNSPEAPAILMNRAAAYAQLTTPDFKNALADLNVILTKAPTNLEAYRLRMQVQSNLKNYAAVVADVTKMLDLSKPKIDPNLLVARAEANITLGVSRGATPTKGIPEFDAAIADYTAVLGLTPTNPTALYNRGFAYSKKSGRKSVPELQKAIADFEAAIKLKPDFVDAWDRLARAYDDYGLNSEPDQEVAWTKAIDAYTKFASLPGVVQADIDAAKKRVADLKTGLNP